MLFICCGKLHILGNIVNLGTAPLSGACFICSFICLVINLIILVKSVSSPLKHEISAFPSQATKHRLGYAYSCPGITAFLIRLPLIASVPDHTQLLLLIDCWLGHKFLNRLNQLNFSSFDRIILGSVRFVRTPRGLEGSLSCPCFFFSGEL